MTLSLSRWHHQDVIIIDAIKFSKFESWSILIWRKKKDDSSNQTYPELLALYYSWRSAGTEIIKLFIEEDYEQTDVSWKIVDDCLLWYVAQIIICETQEQISKRNRRENDDLQMCFRVWYFSSLVDIKDLKSMMWQIFMFDTETKFR